MQTSKGTLGAIHYLTLFLFHTIDNKASFLKCDGIFTKPQQKARRNDERCLAIKRQAAADFDNRT